MSMDELKKKYGLLNSITMPVGVRNKILSSLDNPESSSQTRKERTVSVFRKKVFLMAIGGVTAALLVGEVLVSNINSNSHVNNTNAGLGYGIPTQVMWDGHLYNYKSWVNAVGGEIGVTGAPGHNKVFSIPGKNPDTEIAVELDYPDGKYISAVRTQK